MATKKAQGDSIWFTATAEGLSELSEEAALEWSTWTGKYSFNPAAGGAAVLTGSLTKGADVGVFTCRIGATQTAAIPIGKYTLVCQADNTSVDFSAEFASLALEITTPGVN